ncbi:thioesterase family protein [Rufibacter roseus]|uniref:Thioesterase family protein n=1 Tax=Rufibacter roseus TaxID=1567108 RepID=A0ABW2DNF2_9BACT|nr:hotdog domain-containing protein [Rufibacter roseus]
MKNSFSPGCVKVYRKTVTESDFARFESGLVHPVCSTFALGQAMEWASRLFVLEMKDPDEEGIGTMLHIDHVGPALEGEELEIRAEFKELKGNFLLCDITVKAGERLVATGQTGQKILKKEKIERLLTNSRGS